MTIAKLTTEAVAVEAVCEWGEGTQEAWGGSPPAGSKADYGRRTGERSSPEADTFSKNM